MSFTKNEEDIKDQSVYSMKLSGYKYWFFPMEDLKAELIIAETMQLQGFELADKYIAGFKNEYTLVFHS